MPARIKRGDKVVVLSGKDRGKRGTVRAILNKDNRVLVEGVNIIKRHQRARQQGQASQIIEREAPIHMSKVMLIDPNNDQPTRVGFRRRKEPAREILGLEPAVDALKVYAERLVARERDQHMVARVAQVEVDARQGGRIRLAAFAARDCRRLRNSRVMHELAAEKRMRSSRDLAGFQRRIQYEAPEVNLIVGEPGRRFRKFEVITRNRLHASIANGVAV